MANEQFVRDRIVTEKEYLTQFRNYWTEQMYANTVDFEKAREDQRKNPSLSEMTQMGIIPIAQKIENLAANVQNAKSMKERCEKFLELSEEEMQAKIKDVIDFINKPKLDLVLPK